MNMQQYVLLSGIFFAMTIIIGIWLSRSGKPYNTAILTIHKLIALAAIVIACLLFVNIYKIVETGTFLIAFTCGAGISVLALLATGAVMSIKKTSTTLLRVLHITATVLAIGFTSVILYLIV